MDSGQNRANEFGCKPRFPSVKTMTNPHPRVQTPREAARLLLARTLGFRDCPPALLDELFAGSQLRHLGKGEFAFRRGDHSLHAGMVVRGLLESSVLRADGGRHLLGLLPPGGVFGLIGAIDDQVHSHDLSAREDCDVLAIPAALLRELRRRDVAFVLACERQLIERTSLLFERLMVDSSVPLEARVASMLLMLGNLHGHEEGGQLVIDAKLSQSDLADWLGLSRQRVNFALKQLADEGLITRQYASLTVVDPVRLRLRAQS